MVNHLLGIVTLMNRTSGKHFRWTVRVKGEKSMGDRSKMWVHISNAPAEVEDFEWRTQGFNSKSTQNPFQNRVNRLTEQQIGWDC